MKEWTTGQLPELAKSLEENFRRGVIFEIYEDGSVLTTGLEHKVDISNNLKFEIFSNEHPPPHFRVTYQGETANFRIDNGEKINGGLKLFKKNVKSWHSQNKDRLISIWNETRPSDCPVGKYEEKSI